MRTQPLAESLGSPASLPRGYAQSVLRLNFIPPAGSLLRCQTSGLGAEGGGPGHKALGTWRATVPALECGTRCAGRAEHRVLCHVSPGPRVGVPQECPVTVTASLTASYWSFMVVHIWDSEFPCSMLGGYPNTCCSKSVLLKHLRFLKGAQRGGEKLHPEPCPSDYAEGWVLS